MASTKWYVLIEKDLAKINYLYNSLHQHCELIYVEDFLQNSKQYGDKIDAICGVIGLPLVTRHTREESFVNLMPNVKVLISVGAGLDHLNLPMLWDKGIRVATTGNMNASVTAELGFALMLASARNLKQAITAYKDGIAVSTFRDDFCGRRLLGSTLGIVGMGSIGYMVAERAAAFQMNILYHTRNRRSEEDEMRVRVTYCDTLEKLLVQADFVMLCVPLTNQTRGMIGAKELKLMKSTAVLINIARGGIVDQDALTKALQENSIGGAALDVTTPEPLPRDHPLLHMPNVLVTPHYGGVTNESGKEMCEIVLENLYAGLGGKSMSQELKPKDNKL